MGWGNTNPLGWESRELPKTASQPPFRVPNLVEKQGLADVAPTAGSSSSREKSGKQAHEEKGPTGGPGADEEHHQQAGSHPEQAGVPGEQVEGGAVTGRWKEGSERSGLALDTCRSLA